MWARRLVWLWLPLQASCFLLDGGSGGQSARYGECASAEARLAWRDAQHSIKLGEDRAVLPALIAITQQCPDLVRAHLAYQDVARRLGGAIEQRMVDFYMQPESVLTADASPVAAYLRARLADTAYAQASALDQILGKHGKFAWGYLSRGRVNRGQGRLSTALQDYDEAIALDGSLLEARLERAQVLTELGRNEEAALEYGVYVGENPGDATAIRELVSLLLYRLPRVDEAIMRIDMLEALGDRSLSLRMDRAAAMWLAKLPQTAIEIYLEILQDAPDTARAALNIGLLYYEIVPKDESDRRRFWPRARAAFEIFLARSEPVDGFEQFERTWAVPYRLRRIGDLLGPSRAAPTLDDLRWPQ